MAVHKWLSTLANFLIGLIPRQPTAGVEESPAEERYEQEYEVGKAAGHGIPGDPIMIRKTWRW